MVDMTGEWIGQTVNQLWSLSSLDASVLLAVAVVGADVNALGVPDALDGE